jgi:hypothetical protein
VTDTDIRGLTLSAPSVPGEAFSKTFRVFDRDTGKCVQVCIGRKKAYDAARAYTGRNQNVAIVRNGPIPCATFICGEWYS